jgi:asparaginyl-tRNA synthetase
MKRIEIRDLFKTYNDYNQEQVTICGWARTIRDSKNIAFLSLNDGAFKCVQVVIEREKVANYDEVVKQIVGASFCVTGKLIVTPEAKQPFEINAEEITVLGESASDYPLQKKHHTVEFLRTIPPTFNAGVFGDSSSLKTIKVPTGCVDEYKAVITPTTYAQYVTDEPLV